MASQLWTIPEVMRYWSDHQPDAETFNFVDKQGPKGTWNPRDIYRLSSRFASRLLLQYGFRRGDVIANGIPNSPERLITDLGIILAGCVLVNCQIIERDGSDFWNTVNQSGCRAVIIPVRSANTAYRLFSPLLPDKGQISGCALISTTHAPSFTKVILCQRDPEDPINSLLTSLDTETMAPSPGLLVDPQPSDLALVFATSGSSGFCKLVPRSHEEILRAGRSFEAVKSIKYFSDRPFGWMGGFPFDYLAHCSPRTLQDTLDGMQAVEPLDLWNVISREKCTGAAMLPLTVAKVLETFTATKPEFKLSFIVTGGQPLRKSIAKAIGVLTNAFVVTYASTELGMVCSGVVTDSEKFRDFNCGKPIAGVELKIVDTDSGEPVGPGVQGDVLVKSYLMFKGYNKQPETTDLFTEDGFYRTKDRGMLDESGLFYCYGRSGDVVSLGSTVVYTSWPEGILCKCPDVLEAVVIRYPVNDRRQEVEEEETEEEDRLCACVVARRGSGLDEERLLQFYTSSFMHSERGKGKFLPNLSRILFFESIPQTTTGKISKRDLEYMAKQQLGI